MTHPQPHSHRDEVPTDPAAAEAFWDERYRESEHNNGQPNPVLVEVVDGLPVGTALDLGSGYGDDAIWLAARGWRVTGADVSGTALRQAAERAGAAGVADRTRWERHDLGVSFPEGTFDLVTTHYLHSPVNLPREQVLRRAAASVAPGGTLLVVGHGTLPPWASAHHHEQLPTPEQVWASLDLPASQWQAVRLVLAGRAVTGPGGEQGTMTDSVVEVRRLVP